ncbi:sterol desaturase/sphingolipid hydroxylase (fatty acid hydroxylase superfamily) [Marmoricola sp. OAE513]|uniref:sterol desaturase family protein n=1 Tax=Marmoricola sp. OAE513 TaxID=2817894 RepID=UPI001AE9F63D
MTKASPEIEALAAERLAAEESRITGSRRTTVNLRTTGAEFWKHPSPWMIAAALVGAVVWRALEGDFRISDLLAPAIYVALFPVQEWLIHVFILHWRPRKIAGITIDSELARDHRAHHADPRDIPLVFIPWRSLIAVIAGLAAIGLLAFPRLGQGLTFIAVVAAAGLVYEWSHYLIHSDYKPRTRIYKAIWRNHRLHHYKNEHYWFTVTSTATADKLFRTYPDPGSIKASPTAKNLHGIDA